MKVFCGISVIALAHQALATAAEQQVLSHGYIGKVQPINVAVIGAGAAGASSAYHLSKYAESRNLPINITVFERNTFVGGRSTTVYAYGDRSFPVELGASIFVQVNSILVDAVNEFNLSTSTSDGDETEIPGDSLGIWNGEAFAFTQTGVAGGWWDIAKILWKYGIAPIRTMQLKDRTIEKFLKMYESPVFPFESLTQAAQEVGLLAVTAATGEQYMRENGITGSFGRDIVQASTRVNYAQNLAHIHALEAMVCMATDGAMSVEGGNWRIFEQMINASKATLLLDTAVTAIERHDNRTFALTFESPNGGHGNQNFDAVILASPHQFANLSLPTSEYAPPDKIPYVHLHVTLFTSHHLLSPSFFNYPPDKPVPQVILTTLSEDEPSKRGPEGIAGSPGFFSISLLRSVPNPSTSRQEYLYKIFSPHAPDSAFLTSLLGVSESRTPTSRENSGSDHGDNDEEDADLIKDDVVTWIYRKLWHSYPYEFPRVTFEDPRREEGWYYTGGMDSFISTMETNALMGRNVAALVVEEMVRRGEGERKGEEEDAGL